MNAASTWGMIAGTYGALLSSPLPPVPSNTVLSVLAGSHSPPGSRRLPNLLIGDLRSRICQPGLESTCPAVGQLPGPQALPACPAVDPPFTYLLALQHAPSYGHCPVPLGKGLQDSGLYSSGRAHTWQRKDTQAGEKQVVGGKRRRACVEALGE